jgi:hypothetical protein
MPRSATAAVTDSESNIPETEQNIEERGDTDRLRFSSRVRVNH